MARRPQEAGCSGDATFHAEFGVDEQIHKFTLHSFATAVAYRERVSTNRPIVTQDMVSGRSRAVSSLICKFVCSRVTQVGKLTPLSKIGCVLLLELEPPLSVNGTFCCFTLFLFTMTGYMKQTDGLLVTCSSIVDQLPNAAEDRSVLKFGDFGMRKLEERFDTQDRIKTV